MLAHSYKLATEFTGKMEKGKIRVIFSTVSCAKHEVSTEGMAIAGRSAHTH